MNSMTAFTATFSALRDSDLGNFFTLELPLGGSTVVLADGAQKYELGGISEMYADANGKYYFTLPNEQMMTMFPISITGVFL